MSRMKKNKSGKKIKAVLFDLGKVILDFNFEPAFRELAQFVLNYYDVPPDRISR